MSDVDLQSSVSSPGPLVNQTSGSDPADTSSRVSTPQDGHEVSDSTQNGPVGNEVASEDNVPGEGLDKESVSGVTDSQLDDTPAAVEPTTEEAADSKTPPAPINKGKPTMSVKPPAGKSNGGPPTPLVKRVSRATCWHYAFY